MLRLLAVLFFLALPAAAAPREKPAVIAIDALELPADLSPQRKQLITDALNAARELGLDRYIFGSADPSQGGFDCSGSMFYLLKKAGIDPPRTSAGQFDWIKAAGKLVEVPAEARNLDHAAFSKLRPGDLIFWSGTYEPQDGRTNKITHVQMYLGREKEDGRAVMIGSTDGRSYRGVARCGFGVYDLRLPRAGSKARLVGYGTPPGLVP
ncbi:C40 family peptidase [Haloferula sargassicola]|uniref:NlpC/P60 domain-containing protein n=1 Tax=Haloferula sargassicola TaxID=490096 RepID=A0ABP9UJE7_9BACT